MDSWTTKKKFKIFKIPLSVDYIERPNFKFSFKNLRSWEPTIDDFSSMIILFDPEKV